MIDGCFNCCSNFEISPSVLAHVPSAEHLSRSFAIESMRRTCRTRGSSRFRATKAVHAVTANNSWNYDTTRNTPDVDSVNLVWGNIKHFNQDIEPDEQANLAANLLLEYAVQQAAVVAEYVDNQVRDQMQAEDVTAVINDLTDSSTTETNQKSDCGHGDKLCRL